MEDNNFPPIDPNKEHRFEFSISDPDSMELLKDTILMGAVSKAIFNDENGNYLMEMDLVGDHDNPEVLEEHINNILGVSKAMPNGTVVLVI